MNIEFYSRWELFNLMHICYFSEQSKNSSMRKVWSYWTGQDPHTLGNCDINLFVFLKIRFFSFPFICAFSGSVICDGNVITNVCGQDQVMVIKNAVYGGRSDMKTCGFKEDTDCTVSVTCVVKRLCDGKQNCSINVDQALFNIDPCPGKSKYLYFEFTCADSKPIKQLHGEYS